jgi:capsule polysaccharide modification protein KpsS
VSYISIKGIDMATKIKSLSFEELVAAEKAANAVRKNYEDKVAMGRGIDYANQSEKQQKEYAELSQRLSFVNSVRLRILNEMEKKLLNLDYDD